MPNVGEVLKSEISRLSKKAVRQHLMPVQSATHAHRRQLAALKKHRSQVAKPGNEWDIDKWIRKRSRDIGKKAGYRYAESFKRIKV